MAPSSPAPSANNAFEFYASCPEGFEDALADELRSLGLRHVRRLKGRVSFGGGVADAYRACLWSRLASRIFVTLARFDCQTADDLYKGSKAVAWEDVLVPGATIAISARGVTDALRNSHFSALRIKDAICDRLVQATGRRPDVDTDDPDARILATIRRDRVSLQLDLAGDPLFKRLPREATRPGGAHVLRPDYAALSLSHIKWGRACAESTLPFLVDACCAGGGIVLEAAQTLADRAPGIDRARWGFRSWALHDERTWQSLRSEALERAEAARNRTARIIATDISGDSVSCARRVLKAAGLADRVIFAQPDAQKVARKLPVPTTGHTTPGADTGAGDPDSRGSGVAGGIVCDATEVPLTKLPRLLSLISDIRGCVDASIGAWAPAKEPLDDDPVNAPPNVPLVILTRDDAIERTLGAPTASHVIAPNNEEAHLLVFSGPAAHDKSKPHSDGPVVDLGSGAPCPVLLPESEQFARRLRKVAKARRKWAQREGVSCYRVYDADLPDYSAAIDVYEGSDATPGRWLVIAEYAAPRHIDPSLAEARLLDILALAPRILDVDPEHVYAKARIRSRGGSQYGKQSRSGSSSPTDIRTRRLPLVEEGGLTFAVNFDDYLDTGIFLDHRITRGLVREHARGKRFFLNLFAYTGTATCYAADAGVEETVTVDLSNTYLDWAERNMEQNGFTGPEHHYVRADVMSWIRDMRETRNRWDLIFCDPPTFSNSSKMGRRTWDVQRDHVELLIGVSRLLTREGEAIFSCNLRTFRPDIEELARAGVTLTDITAETIPEDFARNPRIHRCYLVRRHTPEDAMRMAGMSPEAIRERSRELRENARRHKR